MRVIIAAAGTAGHINPGLAIANRIKQEEKDSEIMFIGTTRGLENDLVPRAGYELKTIDAYGLSKKIPAISGRCIHTTGDSVGGGHFANRQTVPSFACWYALLTHFLRTCDKAHPCAACCPAVRLVLYGSVYVPHAFLEALVLSAFSFFLRYFNFFLYFSANAPIIAVYFFKKERCLRNEQGLYPTGLQNPVVCL